jgi:hypothetical protein
MVALYAILVDKDASKQPDSDKKPAVKKVAAKATASITASKPSRSAATGPAHDNELRKDAPDSGSSSGYSLRKIPEVNINLQIHISADASSDQIEQIFASMSKHLYSRG